MLHPATHSAELASNGSYLVKVQSSIALGELGSRGRRALTAICKSYYCAERERILTKLLGRKVFACIE
jgi:hypothetical protein